MSIEIRRPLRVVPIERKQPQRVRQADGMTALQQRNQ